MAGPHEITLIVSALSAVTIVIGVVGLLVPTLWSHRAYKRFQEDAARVQVWLQEEQRIEIPLGVDFSETPPGGSG